MAAAERAPRDGQHGEESRWTMALARLLRSRDWNRGFTLIELLIVILIVGILAAVATPLYLGYIKDAKTAEAKAVAGSLWTAVQSNAIGSCGTDGHRRRPRTRRRDSRRPAPRRPRAGR